MTQFILQTLAFFLGSVTTIIIIYLNSLLKIYQPLVPLFLVLDILLTSQIDTKQGTIKIIPKLIIIYISTILVQLIVISSGGFYSPLLILVHLFTIGAIFVLNSSSPVTFLVFSLCVLIFHIIYDPTLSQFFKNDPWTTVIYGLSIIIVVPLTLFLSKSNSVKNKFTSFLRDYIYMSESRQKSIMTALSNLVIVTDKNLNIVTVNTALERLLRVSASQVLSKPLFQIISLKDSSGNPVLPETLPTKQALNDKATHFVEGYFIETKIQTVPKPITIQIKPISNPQGEVTQLIFVFTDPTVKIGFNTHTVTRVAVKKHASLINLIANQKTNISGPAAQLLTLQIAHIEDDILTAQEMADHPIQEVIGFEDIVALVSKILQKNHQLYTLLKTQPQLVYEDNNKTEAAFMSSESLDSSTSTASRYSALSKYSAPVDGYLLFLILEKLLDLAVFITSSQPQKNISIHIHLANPGNVVMVDINFPSGDIKPTDIPNLFTNDYPGLKSPGLIDSSGLEGYIAGKIAKTIQLEFTPTLNLYTKTITFSTGISKQPKITVT